MEGDPAPRQPSLLCAFATLNLCANLPAARSRALLRHDLAELEDWEDDTGGDEADDAAHEDNHERLDHRRRALDDGLEFAGVIFADFVEDFAELAGLFAGADHLDDGLGE